MQEQKKNHKLCIINREIFEADEVLNVEYFTSEAVAAKTSCGRLIIKGINLIVDTMESKTGQLLIKGKINGIIYENSGEEKSVLKKLFK